MKKIGIIILIALIVLALAAGCGRKELVIVDEVEYPLISYGSTIVHTADDKTVPGYALTLAYPDKKSAEQVDAGTAPTPENIAGVISVPVGCCVRDSSLPLNRVKWTQAKLQGIEYRLVRFHPAHDVPKTEDVDVKDAPPLTR